MAMPNIDQITYIFTFLFFLSIIPSSSNLIDDSIYECLIKHDESPSIPISQTIYSKKNSSYSQVLQSYIRNLRFNESFNPKPEFIISAIHLSHVQASVICGKKHGLQMRIRSGGHDYEGASYISSNKNPFFVLDMNAFRAINVRLEDETAWVQAGATLGELYYKIAEKSPEHAFPAGVCPTVGVGGHFSGGGYGTMMRNFGLSVDNIIDAYLVDVNGKLLNRSSMGEDLFWAITGGGGASFGVIFSFKIKLVRVPPKLTVFLVQKTSDPTSELMINTALKWQEIAHTTDKKLFFRMVIDVVNGTKEGEKRIRTTFRGLFFGESSNLLSVMNESFPEIGLQKEDCIEKKWIETTVFFAEFPPNTSNSILLNRHYGEESYGKMKSDYLKKAIPKQGLKLLFKKMVNLQVPVMQFSPNGGRMSEIPFDEKPFPHRNGNIAHIQYLVVWNQSGIEIANQNINILRDLHEFMKPYVSNSPREALLNYKDFDLGIITNINGNNSYNEGLVYGTKYFKDNFHRLVQIKTKVDPQNFFRHEQSIPTLFTN